MLCPRRTFNTCTCKFASQSIYLCHLIQISDHINVSALACALEAEEMPDLRLLSFGSLHAEEEEGIAQASTRVVKRICKARKIDYQPEVVTAFQHWLAGMFMTQTA